MMYDYFKRFVSMSSLTCRRLFHVILLLIAILLFCGLAALWTSNPWNVESLIIFQIKRGQKVGRRLPIARIDNLTAQEGFNSAQNSQQNDLFATLFKCNSKFNNVTGAVRLPVPILAISLTPPDSLHDSSRRYFNPTLIPLPPYSPYPYLLLSRLVTEGLHQEAHICLASLCLPGNRTASSSSLPVDTHLCSESDLEVSGTYGGVRCATTPERLNIPPTPARRCKGAWSALPDIPGFHDPRVFWSGKGEPLVIINSASRYACVGLWVIDLRVIYSELDDLLSRKGRHAGLNTVRDGRMMEMPARMSYPHLTELTRNPRSSRASVEKNWILFFPRADETWIQYDVVGHGAIIKEKSHRSFGHNVSRHTHYANSSIFTMKNSTDFDGTSLLHGHVGVPGQSDVESEATLIPARSLAKVIGSGYTTHNLTSPAETPCLASTDLRDSAGNVGHWHQGSNSLRLILCSRHDLACLGDDDEDRLIENGKIVHFAVLHRKFSNNLDLPMRYERYVMVWEAKSPFRMIGISQHPILFAGERAQPWTETENNLGGDREANRWAKAYFTYTPSLAWSWRKESVGGGSGGGGMQSAGTRLGTGYLGDDVLVGIGMDDVAQAVAKVKVEELLECLQPCPDFAAV